MNNFALIQKYLTNAIDTVFATESKTRVLENGSKFIDVNFKEAGYVKVMEMLMDGLSDYYRVNGASTGVDYVHKQGMNSGSLVGDGYKKGNALTKWKLYELTYDRGKQFQIDDMDDEESAGMLIGNLLVEFLRTKVVPEVDALRFSKMASKCSSSLGNLVAESISANTIISKFNAAFEWLSEHEVPDEDQVIFVNPAVMTLIRNTSELYKKLSQAEYKGENVTFTIDTYEGRPIIEVPSSRFYTDIVIGDNGFLPASGSKIINFQVCSKKAIIPIIKNNKSKIWSPETVQDFDGYKVNFRLYHDVIIPKNKICGVYTSVSTTAATTKVNLLSVDLTKTTNGYKMTEYYTNPAGLFGAKVVRSASAFTMGATVTTSATIVETPLDTEFTKFGSETAQYYALLDASNKVIAMTGSVTLPT